MKSKAVNFLINKYPEDMKHLKPDLISDLIEFVSKNKNQKFAEKLKKIRIVLYHSKPQMKIRRELDKLIKEYDEAKIEELEKK